MNRDFGELRSIYQELRGVARRLLNAEPWVQTLESTDLVHLAFARLLGGDLASQTRENPREVIALAVLHMRRELIDHARRRRAKKRPDVRKKVDLQDAFFMCEDQPETLLAVEGLLDALATSDRVRNGPRKAEVARYSLYAGLNEAEIGGVMDLPKSTVGDDLRFARAFILAGLEDPSA